MSFKRNIRLLTWFNFFTDFRLYAPIAIIYFATVSKSYALGASVFSVIMIVQALFDVPTGIFSDIIGRKKTVVLGALFAVLSIVFYAIGLNYWILIIGAIAEGMSRAFYSGNNNALLHNLLTEEGLQDEFHVYSGKLNSMFQWALASSAILGSYIANLSFPLVMWLSAIPQAICLFISFGIKDANRVYFEKESPIKLLGQAIRDFVSNANLRLLSISSIIDYGAGEASYQFQAAYYQSVWPIWAIGIAKTISGVLAAIGYRISGKLINKFKAINVLFFGSIVSNVVAWIALIFTSIFSPILMSLTSIFHGTGSTAQVSLLHKEFTDKQRATMSSLNSFAGSLFFAVLIFVLGFITDKIGARNGLLLLSLFAIPSLLIRWKLFNKDH